MAPLVATLTATASTSPAAVAYASSWVLGFHVGWLPAGPVARAPTGRLVAASRACTTMPVGVAQASSPPSLESAAAVSSGLDAVKSDSRWMVVVPLVVATTGGLPSVRA